MKKKINNATILIIIFINQYLLIHSARQNGPESHTKSYLKFKNEREDFLFLKNTYAPVDICKPYKGRKNFINTLPECVGEWCNNGAGANGYKCTNKNQCYQVEHIIDKNGVTDEYLNSCNKDIYGNLVMAYGRWNSEIGQRPWHMVRQEKQEIYKDIFRKAEEAVLECCMESKNGLDMKMLIGAAVIITFLIITIIILIIIIFKKNQQKTVYIDNYLMDSVN